MHAPSTMENPSSFGYPLTLRGRQWMSLLQATVLIPEMATELDRKHSVFPGLGFTANVIFIIVA